MMSRKRQNHFSRKGIVAPLIAVSMVAVLAFVAFAIDIGVICQARTELQRTADSCALTAGWQMPDQDKAISAAKKLALDNFGIHGATLLNEDFQFGYWDRKTAKFTYPTPSQKPTNAVRVTAKRTAERGNPLVLFFASVLNKSSTNVETNAIALIDREFCGPFIGIESVSVSGDSYTDSYDSNVGYYTVGRDEGSVCSDGPVDVYGGAVVNGNATAGKDFDVEITGKARVTGITGNRRRPLNLPLVDATEAAINNDNDSVPQVLKGNTWTSLVDGQGNFLLDGTKEITLGPGTFYFNDFTIKGQSIVNIKGPVKIYVTGNFERSGGAQVGSQSRIPGDLQILMTGGTASITSHDAFYGVVYAPNTHVTVDGSADYYGAIVGKTLVKTGTANGHYDEALNSTFGMLPMRVYLVD